MTKLRVPGSQCTVMTDSALVLMVVSSLGWGCTNDPHEQADAEAHRMWQEERLAELRAEDGWLAVVGLAWLQEGEQTVGWGSPAGEPDPATRDSSGIVLPEPPTDAPAVLATIRVEVTDAGPVAWIAPEACPECRVTRASGSAEQPSQEVEVVAEAGWFPFSTPSGEPPITLHFRGFEVFSMERGGRLALRVRNRNSPRRDILVSIPTHDYAAGWTVEGRFERAEGVRELAIDNSTDYDYPQRSVGRFLFQREGRDYAMELIGTDPEVPLLLMVGDTSNGQGTYGGGRYVYVDVAEGGVIRADFNRLYNPPCVFTPWATCPLPPPSNRLPFLVPVGEQEPIFVAGAK